MGWLGNDGEFIFASGYSPDHVLLSDTSNMNINFIQKPYDFLKLSGHLKRVLSIGQE